MLYLGINQHRNNGTPDMQQQRNPRSYHIVIKAVGSRCNLECGYCYYLGKEKILPESTPGRMSDELLERFTRQYINDQDLDTIIFNWHGGEPALLGLDFYRKAVELQKKHANGKRIENDFQTNGTLRFPPLFDHFGGNLRWNLAIPG